MTGICVSCGAILHSNSVSAIMHRVARYSGVPVEQLKGPRLHTRIAYPRFAVYYLAHVETDKTSVSIGRAIGGRDHSTILHGIARARKLIMTDPGFADLVAKASRDYRDDEPELRLVA